MDFQNAQPPQQGNGGSNDSFFKALFGMTDVAHIVLEQFDQDDIKVKTLPKIISAFERESLKKAQEAERKRKKEQALKEKQKKEAIEELKKLRAEQQALVLQQRKEEDQAKKDAQKAEKLEKEKIKSAEELLKEMRSGINGNGELVAGAAAGLNDYVAPAPSTRRQTEAEPMSNGKSDDPFLTTKGLDQVTALTPKDTIEEILAAYDKGVLIGPRDIEYRRTAKPIAINPEKAPLELKKQIDRIRDIKTELEKKEEEEQKRKRRRRKRRLMSEMAADRLAESNMFGGGGEDDGGDDEEDEDRSRQDPRNRQAQQQQMQQQRAAQIRALAAQQGQQVQGAQVAPRVGDKPQLMYVGADGVARPVPDPKEQQSVRDQINADADAKRQALGARPDLNRFPVIGTPAYFAEVARQQAYDERVRQIEEERQAKLKEEENEDDDQQEGDENGQGGGGKGGANVRGTVSVARRFTGIFSFLNSWWGIIIVILLLIFLCIACYMIVFGIAGIMDATNRTISAKNTSGVARNYLQYFGHTGGTPLNDTPVDPLTAAKVSIDTAGQTSKPTFRPTLELDATGNINLIRVTYGYMLKSPQDYNTEIGVVDKVMDMNVYTQFDIPNNSDPKKTPAGQSFAYPGDYKYNMNLVTPKGTTTSAIPKREEATNKVSWGAAFCQDTKPCASLTAENMQVEVAFSKSIDPANWPDRIHVDFCGQLTIERSQGSQKETFNLDIDCSTICFAPTYDQNSVFFQISCASPYFQAGTGSSNGNGNGSGNGSGSGNVTGPDSNNSCPFSTKPLYCTRPYTTNHLANDYAIAKSTNNGVFDVYAPIEGSVSFLYTNQNSIDQCGQGVIITGKDKKFAFYHMQPGVSSGDTVKPGKFIGRTYTSTNQDWHYADASDGGYPCWLGEHVHTEVTDNGTRKNPFPYIEALCGTINDQAGCK